MCFVSFVVVSFSETPPSVYSVWSAGESVWPSFVVSAPLAQTAGWSSFAAFRIPTDLLPLKFMSEPAFSIDLTRHAPRSPYVRLGGFVILPRLIDKARAALGGKLGEYYDGPQGLNGHFLRFVGIEHEALKQYIATGAGDWDILQWVHANARHPRDAWEIAAWSDYHTRRPVDSDAETLEKFAEGMKRRHPDREDIKTRFDWLDFDDYCSFGGKA